MSEAECKADLLGREENIRRLRVEIGQRMEPRKCPSVPSVPAPERLGSLFCWQEDSRWAVIDKERSRLE